MQFDLSLLDFILNAHPIMKAMLFILFVNVIWFGAILWHETRKHNQMMKDFKAQPDLWAEFQRTGDDYHFMKKGDRK